MALITNRVRGTQDSLPKDTYKRVYVEQTLLAVARDYGFKEMRTPVFEHTELFQRSVGEDTDVVQKEMYTFNDKSNRSITLRPEGTAGVARAFLEHGMHNSPLPFKISYVASCYRYEKPQAGRFREFFQFGVECFGTDAPEADTEIIALGSKVLSELGITGVELNINSIGCPDCRPNYHHALKEYFKKHKDDLCETCVGRLDRNPMRILDCKSKGCAKIVKDAPVMLDFLCNDCKEHFTAVKESLDEIEIFYTVNPKIVRGLDYYTRTVFEFISDALGSQAVVCGGGRYDGLIEELGGKHTPSLGFGMGIERILMVMDAKNIKILEESRPEIYLASLGDKAKKECLAIATGLRDGGVSVEFDIVGRSLKAQMRYANSINARHVIVIGDNELEDKKANLRDMDTGKEEEIALDDSLYTSLYNKSLDRKLADMTGLFDDVAE